MAKNTILKQEIKELEEQLEALDTGFGRAQSNLPHFISNMPDLITDDLVKQRKGKLQNQKTIDGVNLHEKQKPCPIERKETLKNESNIPENI